MLINRNVILRISDYPSGWRAVHPLRSATTIEDTFDDPIEQQWEAPYFHSRPSNRHQKSRSSSPCPGNVAVQCSYPVEREGICLEMGWIWLDSLDYRRWQFTDQPFWRFCDGGGWWLWRESFPQTRTTHYLLHNAIEEVLANVCDYLRSYNLQLRRSCTDRVNYLAIMNFGRVIHCTGYWIVNTYLV